MHELEFVAGCVSAFFAISSVFGRMLGPAVVFTICSVLLLHVAGLF